MSQGEYGRSQKSADERESMRKLCVRALICGFGRSWSGRMGASFEAELLDRSKLVR